ncbi:zinc-binding dehydrogenase [Cryptosporangium phraense]|uniref:Zinc-binding dehydrogenase n=1 Tax=Cryptosporangium phraense TaxID=2593070 RepID=A0A545AM83_9ACTN|nr:zinc-binding dehydrogenase [Cryptosporangium phraense]TQS42428.1 zinc-binding dehydrogenase [Cryptosporangium phraense]
MRAIQLTAFGDPSVLVPVDVPDPVPASDQVLVDVERVSISFVETQIRAGRPPRAFPLPEPPFIPGNGVGGVVSAVGPGVDPGLVGRRVFATTGGHGGYASKAVAAVSDLVEIPAGISTADGVALATDGRTALGLFRLAAPGAGEIVLVESAAGGVGTLLVQLSLRAGARVIGVSSGGKLNIVKKRTEAIDYGQPEWADRVRELTAGAAVDVVFDGVGGAVGTAAAGLVSTAGRFVIHGAASGSMTDPATVNARILTLRDIRETVAELSRDALTSGLSPLVGQVLPLERAADAHARIEARTAVGKTLLAV